MSCKHKTKQLTVGSREGEVDLGNYDLIKELWNADLSTTHDCESEPTQGKTSIVFRSSNDAELFLTIVNSGDDDNHRTLTERATRSGMDNKEPWALNLGVFPSDQNSRSEVDINLCVQILIPKADYDDVLNLMRDFNS